MYENTKRWIHTAIVVFLMFFFRFLPPAAPVTETGMAVIGVFAGAIWGWIFIDIGWPSILGVFALGTTSYTTMTDLFPTVFGSQNAVLILSLLIITAFVESEGLSPVICQWLLSRKATKNRPYLTVFFFLLACFASSLLGYANAAVLIFIELLRAMMKETGMKPYSRQLPVFLCGFPIAVTLGDCAVPFKASAIVFMSTYASVTGTDLNAAKFTLFALPVSVMLLGAYTLICKYVLRIDMSMLKGYEVSRENQVEVTPRKKAALAATVLVLVGLLLPNILPSSWSLTAKVASLGLGGLALAFLVILSLVRVEGKPLVDVMELAPHFKWKVFFLASFILPTASALMSDSTGIKEAVSGSLQGIASSLPGIAYVVFVLLGTFLVTNICNNMVVASIFTSLVCVMATTMPGLTVPALCVCISLTSDFACFFPSACPPAAICFAQKDMVDFKAMFKQGVVSGICLVVVMLVVAWPYANLIF